MVLADIDVVDTELVGEDRLVYKVTNDLRRMNGLTRIIILHIPKGVEAEL
jgi:hypothetical protein